MPRHLFVAILMGCLLVSVSYAQETFAPMQTRTGSLNEGQTELWAYSADYPTTVFVETVSGTLDPRLELLNAAGDTIVSNNDFAPEFSTAARLNVPAGDYTLRISGINGTGDYQMTAVAGEMQPQWNVDFPADFPEWMLPNALPLETEIQLQTPLTTTRLFTPNYAPQRSDVYLQMNFRWGEIRAESEAGLSVRSRVEQNGQVAGIRLETTPQGEWFLRSNDGLGTEVDLASGILPNPEAESITLGLLAQDEYILALADGIKLAEVENTDFDERGLWGVLIYDAQIVVDDFWLATQQTDLPLFPAQIEAWQATESNEITTELISEGVLPPNGTRRLLVPSTQYTVTGIEQRNFLVTEESVLFDNVVVGGDVQVIEGGDVGCGFVGRFNSREEKTFAYADTQGGAGLLWWRQGELILNDYAIVPAPNPTQNRLILILQDQFAAVYVNGELILQDLIPLRAGNVGVGFANFADGNATCFFKNIWIWQ